MTDIVIYDCMGTLQGSPMAVWADRRFRTHNNESAADFQKSHPGPYVMYDGMADLVRYTSRFTKNILLSSGNPAAEGCPELLKLKHYFSNWKYDGKVVPWGQTPCQMFKNDPRIAQALVQQFQPTRVVVIGDALEDFDGACNFPFFMRKLQPVISAPMVVAFIRRGLKIESCVDSPVPVIALPVASEMMKIIEKIFQSPHFPSATIKKIMTKNHQLEC